MCGSFCDSIGLAGPLSGGILIIPHNVPPQARTVPVVVAACCLLLVVVAVGPQPRCCPAARQGVDQAGACGRDKAAGGRCEGKGEQGLRVQEGLCAAGRLGLVLCVVCVDIRAYNTAGSVALRQLWW